MNARSLLFFCVPLVACSSSTPSNGPPVGAAGSVSSGGAGLSAGGAATAGSGFAAAGADATAGTSAGGATLGGAPAGGASEGGATPAGGAGGTPTAAGSGGAMASAGAAGASTVPADYTGTPFKALTIPGFIYGADYDKGGAGVGYCRVGAANPPTVASCMTAKINDWCCGTQKGCDERTQPNVCPIYRMDNDNAGLSHMNTGEPDNYSITSATWVAGANGPTMTGPMATAGTPVPQHANTTTADDAYLSYLYTGQWQKYTVQVMAPGTYSIGGLPGVAGCHDDARLHERHCCPRHERPDRSSR